MGLRRISTVGVCALLLLAAVGCGTGRSSGTGADPTAGVALPFPKASGVSDLESTTVLGKAAYQRSPGCINYSGGLFIRASQSSAPEWAVYRFNAHSDTVKSIVVMLSEAGTTAAYLGLADFATGKWDFSGPYTSDQLLDLEGKSVVSADGNVYVAVVAPPGRQAIVEALGIVADAAPNVPPQASFYCTPSGGEVPLTITADASASSDSDGEVAFYQWDWEGDGAYEETTLAPRVSHHYAAGEGGTIPVHLRVVDNDMATAEYIVYLALEEDDPPPPPVNQYPTASFTFTQPSGPAPLEVVFDASASSDPDGTIVQYAWDWEGDGSYEAYGSSPINSHIYTASGIHNPRLTVTDNGGKANSKTANWSLGIDPLWQSSTVSANGNAYAPVSWIVSGGVLSAAYSRYQAMDFVSATDATATSWHAVTVASGEPNLPSLAEVQGSPAIAYVESSPSSSPGLRYVFALDGAGASWSSPIVVANPIQYGTVRLLEVDGNPAIFQYYGDYRRALNASGTAWGAPIDALTLGSNSSAAIVNGNPAVSSGGSSVYFTRALDPDGAAWPASQIVAGSGSAVTSLAVIQGSPAIAYGGNSPSALRYVRALDSDGALWGPPVQISLDGVQQVELAEINGLPRITFRIYSPSSGSLCVKYAEALDPAGDAWRPAAVVALGDDPHLIDLNGEPVIGFLSGDGIQLARLP